MHFISATLFSVLAILGTTAISGASAAGCSSINREATDLIKNFGGFVASPNPKSTGQPVIGYGHTCKQKRCSDVPYRFPLTTTSAAELLQKDLQPIISCLDSNINSDVELNDNQWGALASWTFSVGCGSARTSALVKRLNTGDDPNEVAKQELPKWNKSGGNEIAGLTRRREAEVKLFQTPSPNTAFPDCSTD
ncbi:hypothetical protein GGH97_004276 [Coemansia sp. RSA 475]|nr:hypothetical protein GGH97_004276 [Coemansia sp. RSA 475]